MARYSSACALLCGLAIAMLALGVPESGFAGTRHPPRAAATHHSRRHHRNETRDRAHNTKRTSTAHATKKASAKPGRGSNQAAVAPSSSATKSAAPTAPASESPPSPLSPADPLALQEPLEAPVIGAPQTPAPEEPTKTSAPGEPAKSPTTTGTTEKETPQTLAPRETTTKDSPPETSTPSQRKLIWSDEFNGSAGSAPGGQWQFDTGGGGWGNEELETYTSRAANAELNGQGDLAMTARAEKYTGTDGITRNYTSARLQTLNTFKFQYGLVEARIQVPTGQGLVAQFWMLGQEAYEKENWPACGEIDTMEVLGSEPAIVNGTLHAPWPWAPTGDQGQDTSTTPLSAGFHTYSVEWEPERIRFMLDGSVYKTITPADLPAGAAWPFKHPFFLLMDLAVGGEWPGSPNSSTHFPAQMLVDWVRVWQ